MRANRLADAIEQMGHSMILLQKLAGIEGEIARIDEKLALANQPLDLAFSLEFIRDFASEKATDFTAAFASEPKLAKEILARHIDRLVLTPSEQDGRMVYDVTGDIDLFGGDGKAMSLIIGAYTSRSLKRRRISTANSGQNASGQECAKAFDPVSGHHILLDAEARTSCRGFPNRSTACPSPEQCAKDSQSKVSQTRRMCSKCSMSTRLLRNFTPSNCSRWRCSFAA